MQCRLGEAQHQNYWGHQAQSPPPCCFGPLYSARQHENGGGAGPSTWVYRILPSSGGMHKCVNVWRRMTHTWRHLPSLCKTMCDFQGYCWRQIDTNTNDWCWAKWRSGGNKLTCFGDHHCEVAAKDNNSAGEFHRTLFDDKPKILSSFYVY